MKPYKMQTLKQLIIRLGDKLVSWYRGVSDDEWVWFENYFTYGNSILPDALLTAYRVTKNEDI